MTINNKPYGKDGFYPNESTFIMANVIASNYNARIRHIHSKVLKTNKKQFIYFLRHNMNYHNTDLRRINFNELNMSILKKEMINHKNRR